jgi:membrane-bound lytic murein transglycosylase
MALDFRAQMFGGNKRKINNRPVIEAVLHDPTRVDELFECVKDDDAYVRMRASDALEKVCRANASIVQPLKTRVLNEMSAIDQPSVQWHYAQIVDQLQLTPQETAKVMSKLQANFEKYDDWITRNSTMEVLGHFALQDEALRAYLVPKLEELTKERIVSLSTRACKILKQLESRS